MPEETITLRDRDGATSPAQAEVVRIADGARMGRMIAFIVGGLVLGGGCLLTPGPHILVTTWLLPLIGIVMGIKASKTSASISRVEGLCPACGKDPSLLGGKVTNKPATDQCRSCRTMLEMVPADA